MLPQDSGSSKIIFVKDNCVENFSFLCFMIYFFFSQHDYFLHQQRERCPCESSAEAASLWFTSMVEDSHILRSSWWATSVVKKAWCVVDGRGVHPTFTQETKVYPSIPDLQLNFAALLIIIMISLGRNWSATVLALQSENIAMVQIIIAIKFSVSDISWICQLQQSRLISQICIENIFQETFLG